VTRWLSTTFAALEVRDFRILWIGGLISFVAFFMAMIVQSVVAFEIAGNNRAVGLVVFCQGFAMAAFGPIGGAFADRWPRRRVIATAQAISALIFTTLAWLIATNNIDITRLAIGSTFVGATLAFLGPARQGMVVDVVSIERRGNAMAISTIANTAARVMGPAVAGALLAAEWSGAVGAYLAMALLYAGSALSLALLPRSVVRAGARERPIFADIVLGVRYVVQHRRLLLLMTLFISVILAGFPHVTVLPGLIENVLGRPAEQVSQLFVASAAGALTASISVARFGDAPRAHLIYTALGCLFGISLIAVALAPSLGWMMVAMVGVGAGSGGFQSLNGAVIARETEPEYIGRVMSLAILAFAGFGLMALPYGALADWLGEWQTLVVMGLAVLSLCAVLGSALAKQSRGTQELPHVS
jgi:MFS family permease